MEQRQLCQKRPYLDSEPKSHSDGDRKRLRLKSQFDSKAGNDASKQSALKFEALSNLIHEIKEAKVQLGLLVADLAAKQELAGLINISQRPCVICGHGGAQPMQGDDSEGSSTFDDDGSQSL